jgi:hypothetical protein
MRFIIDRAEIGLPTASVTASRDDECRIPTYEISAMLRRIGREFVNPIPINAPPTVADMQPCRSMPEGEHQAEQKG